MVFKAMNLDLTGILFLNPTSLTVFYGTGSPRPSILLPDPVPPSSPHLFILYIILLSFHPRIALTIVLTLQESRSRVPSAGPPVVTIQHVHIFPPTIFIY